MDERTSARLSITRRTTPASQGDDGEPYEHYKKDMTLRTDPLSTLSGYGMRSIEFLRHLPQFARLYWRLFRDPRVSVWPKALLAVGVLYVLSPLDLIPDYLPVIGEVDDLVVLIVLCRLFVYLCPPEIVREHVGRIDAENR